MGNGFPKRQAQCGLNSPQCWAWLHSFSSCLSKLECLLGLKYLLRPCGSYLLLSEAINSGWQHQEVLYRQDIWIVRSTTPSSYNRNGFVFPVATRCMKHKKLCRPLRASTEHLRNYARWALQMDAHVRQSARLPPFFSAWIFVACIGSFGCIAPSSSCMLEFLSAWFILPGQHKQVFSYLGHKQNDFLV